MADRSIRFTQQLLCLSVLRVYETFLAENSCLLLLGEQLMRVKQLQVVKQNNQQKKAKVKLWGNQSVPQHIETCQNGEEVQYVKKKHCQVRRIWICAAICKWIRIWHKQHESIDLSCIKLQAGDEYIWEHIRPHQL